MSDPDERALARLLDNPAVWAEVPPGLKERVLAQALGEPSPAEQADDEDDADDVVVTPLQRTPGDARPERPPLWQRPALLAAAAVVLVGIAVGGTLVATRDEAPPAGIEVALAGTENAPGASATVELRAEPSGFSVTLDVSGLPPAPDGTFYEAWLVSESLGKISAGTFHIREPQDDITLWLGVDPADYDAFSITRQPVRGGSLAEGVPMLRGELP